MKQIINARAEKEARKEAEKEARIEARKNLRIMVINELFDIKKAVNEERKMEIKKIMKEVKDFLSIQRDYEWYAKKNDLRRIFIKDVIIAYSIEELKAKLMVIVT